jgi:hypothetical protein
MGEKVYRTTISIPQDLKKRMEAVADQVNWSAVAARAFEAKLAEVHARKVKTMTKEDVVQRLKSLEGQESEEEYAEGKQAGRAWAEREATPKELRRLARYIDLFERERSGPCWWDVELRGWRGGSATDCFVFAIRPSRKDDASAPREFWEEVLGDDDAGRIEDADFFHGFGDGAVEVWNEVCGEL